MRLPADTCRESCLRIFIGGSRRKPAWKSIAFPFPEPEAKAREEEIGRREEGIF